MSLKRLHDKADKSAKKAQENPDDRSAQEKHNKNVEKLADAFNKKHGYK